MCSMYIRTYAVYIHTCMHIRIYTSSSLHCAVHTRGALPQPQKNRHTTSVCTCTHAHECDRTHGRLAQTAHADSLQVMPTSSRPGLQREAGGASRLQLSRCRSTPVHPRCRYSCRSPVPCLKLQHPPGSKVERTRYTARGKEGTLTETTNRPAHT